METTSKIILWLFIINLGISFGAGLYETRIAVPEWLSYSAETGYVWNAEAARRFNVGLRFWVFVTTIPLTLLTLMSLIIVWQAKGDSRLWWQGAIAAVLVDRVLTFAYFIPTMLKLMREDNALSPAAAAKAVQWVNLGYIRHALALIAWLAAMKTFSLVYAQQL